MQEDDQYYAVSTLESLFPSSGLHGVVTIVLATAIEEVKLTGFAKSVKRDPRRVILWSLVAAGALKVERVGALRALELTPGGFDKMLRQMVPEGRFVVVDCAGCREERVSGDGCHCAVGYYPPGAVVDRGLDVGRCSECKFIGYVFEIKSMFKGAANAGS